MIGVKQMLSLVWSRESAVKEEVVAAYKRLYIEVEPSDEERGKKAKKARSSEAANAVAQNFMMLVSGATVGELASLEELVTTLVKSGDLGKEVFQVKGIFIQINFCEAFNLLLSKVLWQHFTRVGSSASDSEDSRCALVLLGMVANAEPAVITQNLSLLVRTALTDRGLGDFQLAHDACEALCKV